ncbi:hypothetical protein [Lysinibacillus capsici]|uniref:hypothetical protein n=1 Tax=Lysinibacillus capsici TaxID=2115968 RepID=UPI0024817981|nr:hypothetical protein [Lysinibacillus capsici]
MANGRGSEEEISLFNDYDFEQLDDYQQSSYKQFEGLDEIKKGSLTMTVLWYYGAVVEEPEDPPQYITPKRISREIKAANAIWRTHNGERAIEFTGIYTGGRDLTPRQNTETLDEEGIIDLIRDARDAYPHADIFVCYLPGENFMGTKAVARAVGRTVDNKLSYLIIMSNGARARVDDSGIKQGQDYFLAHELGHILYFSNYKGDQSDPNPKPSDKGHHRDDTEEGKKNLMAPTAVPYGEIPTLTDEQIKKGLESTFFRDNR